jgi:hypothetical protein
MYLLARITLNLGERQLHDFDLMSTTLSAPSHTRVIHYVSRRVFRRKCGGRSSPAVADEAAASQADGRRPLKLRRRTE